MGARWESFSVGMYFSWMVRSFLSRNLVVLLFISALLSQSRVRSAYILLKSGAQRLPMTVARWESFSVRLCISWMVQSLLGRNLLVLLFVSALLYQSRGRSDHIFL